MSAKIIFTGLVFLVLGILTYYFILTVNTSLDSKVKINKQIQNTKVDRHILSTQSLRLRANHYHPLCEKMNLDDDERQVKHYSLRNIIVNDEHQLLYCPVPKIACSNLIRVFLILTGKTNQSDPLKLKSNDVHHKYNKFLTRLHTYTKEQVEYRLRRYKKVLFVREPFERILSAYRNKFLYPGQQPFTRQFGRQIIKTFRSNASEKSLKLGNDVTFEEFVQYLIKLHQNRQPFNAHWATYADLCSPCQIQYDFVGRFETMDDDVDFLLELMGLSDTIKFPRRNTTYKTTKTADVLYQFYRHIEPKNIEKLWKIYTNDFKLFEYAIPGEIIKILRGKGP